MDGVLMEWDWEVCVCKELFPKGPAWVCGDVAHWEELEDWEALDVA